jgi:N-acetyl-anhydromuramyl-L-alanine amidase AmpD
MSLRRALLASVISAACAAASAGAGTVTAPKFATVPANRANYGATRPAAAIRGVVVHDIEGSYLGAIAWFANRRAHASANYVVSREGRITRTVPESRVAWHAGNTWWNLHAIGIEHEGYTGWEGTFTDREYRASAQLVAWIMRRYLLPIDRRHIIGHGEVPDPRRPWLGGGIGHHSDPGPYWDWTRYMRYVRSYAIGRTPPPPIIDVTMPGLAIGQTLSGDVTWQAVTAGQIDHVNFLVDGALRDVQRASPYVFDAGTWDTTNEANETHDVTVRAVTADGHAVVSTVLVKVRNAKTPLHVVDTGLTEGQTLTGLVRWEPRISGHPVRVEYLVDGVLRDTRYRSPYVFGGIPGGWDTTKETPGPHVLTVRAVGRYGFTTLDANVVIGEQPPPPPPPSSG